MGEKIKNFITRPWVSFVLALLTLFSVAWAIYEHYYIPNPNVQLEVVSEAQLFNNTDRVSSLNVFVDSLDIRDTKQNVTLYTIKISNNGRKHLGSSDYEGECFGIKVENGIILDDNDLLVASNDYIEQAFNQYIPEWSNTFLDLPRVAMDINDYYVFSFAILHSICDIPLLKPLGKVLGQKEIDIISTSSKEQLPFFERVFYGDIWAHLFRVLIGLVIVFLFALLGAIGTVGSEAASEKRRARKFIHELATNKIVLSFIKDDVLNNGVEDIEFAHKQMEVGINEMNKIFKLSKAYLTADENLLHNDYETYRQKYAGYISLMSKGYLDIDEEETIIIPIGVKDSVDMVYSLMGKYHLHRFSIKRYLTLE